MFAINVFSSRHCDTDETKNVYFIEHEKHPST